MPGCERSTPDVVGGCFGDPSIRECCCNERSYVHLRRDHDFKRWTYFETDVIPAPRELIEEYTESVVQLGVRQVVDNTIVIDQPCIARRIGREYDRTDEFGNGCTTNTISWSSITLRLGVPSRRSSSGQTTTFRSGSMRSAEKFRPAAVPNREVGIGSGDFGRSRRHRHGLGRRVRRRGRGMHTQSNLNLTLGVYARHEPAGWRRAGGQQETIRKGVHVRL